MLIASDLLETLVLTDGARRRWSIAARCLSLRSAAYAVTSLLTLTVPLVRGIFSVNQAGHPFPQHHQQAKPARLCRRAISDTTPNKTANSVRVPRCRYVEELLGQPQSEFFY